MKTAIDSNLFIDYGNLQCNVCSAMLYFLYGYFSLFGIYASYTSDCFVVFILVTLPLCDNKRLWALRDDKLKNIEEVKKKVLRINREVNIRVRATREDEDIKEGKTVRRLRRIVSVKKHSRTLLSVC